MTPFPGRANARPKADEARQVTERTSALLAQIDALVATGPVAGPPPSTTTASRRAA